MILPDEAAIAACICIAILVIMVIHSRAQCNQYKSLARTRLQIIEKAWVELSKSGIRRIRTGYPHAPLPIGHKLAGDEAKTLAAGIRKLRRIYGLS